MTWETISLGEFLTLKRGYDLPADKRLEGNVPIVSSSGTTGRHNIAKVKGPGVVTGRYGTLGEVFYITEDFWPLNTALYVQDFKGSNPRFAFYFLKTVLRSTSSDKAAVPGVNRNDLHARRVTVTRDPEQQQRISAVLSAYDDLIDNNRQRIRLLEEEAQLLYKEWFVHLRFPGHEHVTVVDGVPARWEKVALGSIAPLKYGKALKEDDRVPGPYPVYGSSGMVGTHESALVKGPGIIVGRKGNVGSIYWSDNDFCPIDTVYYIEAENARLYLYYALLHTNFISTDVAVPGLNRDYAHGREVLIANPALIQEFESVVAPIHAQISVLRRYNRQVSKARDLLLPKLMNGELQV